MTKPMGAIPAGYEADGDGMLLIGGTRADALVAGVGGTPLFAYDSAMAAERIARFRAAFSGTDLHYAVKANPYAPLLKFIASKVDGLDVASASELRLAVDAGADPRTISFAGPGKRDEELELAIRLGATLNLESEGEADRALAVAARLGATPRLAVRVNPDFELRGSSMRMGGGARPFGVDAERVPALVRRLLEARADWRGFHIFAGSQALDAAAIAEAQAAGIALAARLAQAAGAPPPTVNLGGGFGVPYVHGERPLDVEAVGDRLRSSLGKLPQVLEHTKFVIELGRWLVAEAGVYLTRIVDRKISHGRTFLITDGGMHHQLAASGNFGQVVRRNFPAAIASRFGSEAEEDATIVGCLCTPLDILADDVSLPRAEAGDLVAIFLAGAYGLNASPQAFLGHPPAFETLVNDPG